MITVVGGVYREVCAFPIWDQYYGSAGRAAAAIASIAGYSGVRLHTALSSGDRDAATISLGSLNVDVESVERKAPIVFTYLTPLSEPTLSASEDDRERTITFKHTSENVILFGMIEASPTVEANRCVYDPQSPKNPCLFKDTGSSAKSLTVIMNKSEAQVLFGSTEPRDLAKRLREAETADISIIKSGLHGCWVNDGCSITHVRAFDAKNCFSIGSGDIFVAAFGYAWMQLEKGAVEAAEYASRSVARYVETKDAILLPTDDARLVDRSTIEAANQTIYLASPFREISQRWFVDETRMHLQDAGMKVFSPVHDIGHGSAEEVVKLDLDAIQQSERVFAILNGSSPGTVFEVGYAAALEKDIYCVAQNMRPQDLKLPNGSGCNVFNDYATAIFCASKK